jgi:hypothetical protein
MGKKDLGIRVFQKLCEMHHKTHQASWAHHKLESQFGIHMTLGGAAK